jgi:hypothetical protein
MARQRISFEYDEQTWTGWRYDWPASPSNIDRYTAWFADARPGPPLRLEAFNDGELVQRVDWVTHHQADTLPPPYSAKQIRRDMAAGTEVTLKTTQVDGATSFDHWTVIDANDTHATIQYANASQQTALARDTETFEGASPWEELRDHASFPQFAADRVRETFVTALGTFHGWRYVVPSRGRDGDTRVHTYWFADALAGPPMVHTEVARGLTLRRIEQIKRSR